MVIFVAAPWRTPVLLLSGMRSVFPCFHRALMHCRPAMRLCSTHRLVPTPASGRNYANLTRCFASVPSVQHAANGTSGALPHQLVKEDLTSIYREIKSVRTVWRRSIDWLIDCSIDTGYRLIDWLCIWLFDGLCVWLIDWFPCCFVAYSSVSRAWSTMETYTNIN